MIASLRWPSDTGPSMRRPASSGPRWRRTSVIRSDHASRARARARDPRSRRCRTSGPPRNRGCRYSPLAAMYVAGTGRRYLTRVPNCAGRHYTCSRVMTVAEVYRALWRRRFLIGLMTLALVAVVAAVTSQQTKLYKASVLVRVEQKGTTAADQFGSLQTGALLAGTYARHRRDVVRRRAGEGAARPVRARVRHQDQRVAGG